MKEMRVISVALEIGVPVYLHGAPGVGKTALIRQLAQEKGWHLEVVIVSLHDPTDFSGLPVKVDGRAVFAPPEWAVRLCEAGKSGGALLFLDELSTAPPAVQAAALRVVHERVVGYLRLPESVRVVAAGNDPREVEGAWELTPPLANRFMHLSFKPSVEQFIDWLMGGEGAFALAQPKEGWEGLVPEKRALIAAFLKARPELAHSFSPERGSGPWPSYRTWDMTALFLAAAEGVLSEEEIFLGMAGLVGEGAAHEFSNYLSNLDLPDPEAVLKGKAELPMDREDRTLAALLAVVRYVCQRDGAYLEKAFDLMADVADRGKVDLAVCAARRLNAWVVEKGLRPPESLRRLAPHLRRIWGL